ncbi:MAG: hypothetical protein RL701_6068 [Pseudomonadota bacterium]|jgi:uncharacterized membrane protein YqjE
MADFKAPDPESSAESEKEPTKAAKLLKGCGCLTGFLVMTLGILIIGNFDKTAWASALTAGVVGILVFSFSGINGMWEK